MTVALEQFVDFNQTSFWLALASITFNPTFWNIVAQNEYRNKTITKVVGSAYTGCYLLAVTIFSLGMVRDTLYSRALKDQPVVPLLPKELAVIVPAVLALVGQTFVISSTWMLGVTGTFLGDYFGILMNSRVEGFPFNVVRDPMYTGSTLSFLAGALWYERPAGLLITLYVHIAYRIALKFEGPFTDMIYRNRSNAQAAAAASKKKEL